MKFQPTTLRIESIIFDNVDTKVLIKGETFKNHLSYCSEMFISFADLNLILNDLQQKNPNVNVCELFVEEQIGSDYSQSILDGKQIENTMIDLLNFSFVSEKMLIRA